MTYFAGSATIKHWGKGASMPPMSYVRILVAVLMLVAAVVIVSRMK